MIVLDRDVLVELSASNRAVIDHLEQYRNEAWTITVLVAWESYKARSSRPEMKRVQRTLQSSVDRIVEFTDEMALEVAYLDEKLRSRGVDLPPVDLLNLATAHTEAGTFVTRNRRDFGEPSVESLADIDIIDTSE
jgi:tRNA(fMet)-specific endonuclease VapC